MDLESATTEDMLMEFKRREMQFVFAGELNSNRPHGEILFAYQGTSQQELARLLRLVLDQLLNGHPDDCT